MDGYGPVADIMVAHHERWDGAGYPRNLAGDAIPLAARLISVADTYDVLTARDSYRKPVAPAAAVAELHRHAGTQFDPEMVERSRGCSRRGSSRSATPTTRTSTPRSPSSTACATSRATGRGVPA